MHIIQDPNIDLFKSNAVHGIGLFETILIKNNEIINLNLHLERLSKSAQFFSFNQIPSENEIIESIKILPSEGILKLVLLDNKLFVNIKNKVPPKIDHAKFVLSKKIKRISTSALSRHKTLSYLENILLEQEAIENNVFESIALNEKEELCDGSKTNIILKLGNNLYTPHHESGCLPGIARSILIQEGLVKEIKLYEQDLINAKEIYLVNSIRGKIEASLVK